MSCRAIVPAGGSRAGKRNCRAGCRPGPRAGSSGCFGASGIARRPGSLWRMRARTTPADLTTTTCSTRWRSGEGTRATAGAARSRWSERRRDDESGAGSVGRHVSCRSRRHRSRRRARGGRAHARLRAGASPGPAHRRWMGAMEQPAASARRAGDPGGGPGRPPQRAPHPDDAPALPPRPARRRPATASRPRHPWPFRRCRPGSGSPC